VANWRKICCAVDFSETSRLAVREAAELAGHSGGALVLVHVPEGPTPSAATIVAPPELFESMATEEAQKLEAVRREAEAAAGVKVEARMLQGNPAEEIVRYARLSGADLVVIGTHGRRGLRRMVLGSVAAQVVREAHCPVLVVRSPPA